MKISLEQVFQVFQLFQSHVVCVSYHVDCLKDLGTSWKLRNRLTLRCQRWGRLLPEQSTGPKDHFLKLVNHCSYHSLSYHFQLQWTLKFQLVPSITFCNRVAGNPIFNTLCKTTLVIFSACKWPTVICLQLELHNSNSKPRLQGGTCQFIACKENWWCSFAPCIWYRVPTLPLSDKW